MSSRQVPDEAAMAALGSALAARIEPPLLIGLSGPLGAGKTTLVRALLHALGHVGAVRSPTYTLLETYELPGMTVQHLDLYRVSDPDELEFLGLRDLTGPHAVWIIEWPDRGRGWLPELDWRIEIEYANESGQSGRIVHGLPDFPDHAL